MKLFLFALATLGLSSLAAAESSPLIDSAYLKSRIGQHNVVVLETQPLSYYTRAHIKGSVHTDYSQWRILNDKGIGQMLPGTDYLELLIGNLGIDHQSEVIIVPVGRGAGDMATATRIYWTLHIAGLNSLSILDGGLIAYYEKFGDAILSTGNSNAVAKAFKANLRQDEILNMDKVMNAVEAGKTIVDARSPDEYIGRVSGSPVERPGALPSAINLPYDTLMQADGSRLKSVETLREDYKSANIMIEGEEITYCHTGHRASLNWFVSHELFGNASAKLYDGSTLEWSATPKRPLIMRLNQEALKTN